MSHETLLLPRVTPPNTSNTYSKGEVFKTIKILYNIRYLLNTSSIGTTKFETLFAVFILLIVVQNTSSM